MPPGARPVTRKIAAPKDFDALLRDLFLAAFAEAKAVLGHERGFGHDLFGRTQP